MGKIIPAILTENRRDLKNKLKMIVGLTDWVHIDIMDGKFVKNVSVSLHDLKKIKIPFHLELHLMVLEPQTYFLDCQKLKSKRVIWHLEAAENPLQILKEMKKYNFQKGMALNPGTSIENIKPCLAHLGLVLLLAGNPGFQGQKFNPIVLKKVKDLRKISRQIKIGVDIGVNLSNIQKIARTGTDNLVVGSSLFQSKNIRKTLELLKAEVAVF